MTVQRMGMGSGVEGARSGFAPGWRGWFLLVAVSGALCLSPVPAAAAMIDEINVTVIPTTYVYDYNGGNPIGQLTIERTSGVELVITRAGVAQESLFDTYFKFTTTLSSDDSDPNTGQAIGIFTGGEITIRDGSATGDLLFRADIVRLELTENMSSEIFLLAGHGTFTDGEVHGDLAEFATSGLIGDVTWKLTPGSEINSFAESFTGDSNVSLLPEPVTMSLLAMGGMVMLIRRKRGRGV